MPDIWCRPTAGSPWALQLMVDDTAGDEWLHRRDRRIRRAVSQLAGPASTDDRLVLAPEARLLHKSHDPRPKGLDDFHAAAGSLCRHQRHWRRSALSGASPGHDWLSALWPGRLPGTALVWADRIVRIPAGQWPGTVVPGA